MRLIGVFFLYTNLHREGLEGMRRLCTDGPFLTYPPTPGDLPFWLRISSFEGEVGGLLNSVTLQEGKGRGEKITPGKQREREREIGQATSDVRNRLSRDDNPPVPSLRTQ